ncbi:FkbM family methyltransferase [Candidatus Pelagibacter sp.]|nr:FkbM family methyltransferase [Candidatus Pelagibacter sp.]
MIRGVLLDDKKKLLLNFIDYLKNFKHDFKSQLFQDIFASFIIGENFDKTFLEFGATNGIDLSNTFTLEKDLSWSGALAEPDNNWIDSLKKNRPNSKIITKCIWSKSGEKMNFFSSDVGALSTLDDFKNSDIKSMPANTALRIKSGKNIEVETISLNQVIVEEFNDNSPSYISIDTEGSEFEILNSFNFSKYHPAVFTIEHNFTDFQNKIDQLMLDNNYIRIFRELTAFDAWYISSKAFDKLG